MTQTAKGKWQIKQNAPCISNLIILFLDLLKNGFAQGITSKVDQYFQSKMSAFQKPIQKPLQRLFTIIIYI